MKLDPSCIGCLFNQIVKAFNLLNPDSPNEIIIEAQKQLMKFLLKHDVNDGNSPLAGQTVYRIIADTLNIKDPYFAIKKKYNQIALKYYDKVKEIIDNSEDQLFEALIVSALGNTLDPASQHDINLIKDIENFNVNNLVINDFEKFKISLEKAEHLLLILDNSGEIVFDKLLILTLKKLYPYLAITCTVREAPIINDATMEDAKSIGLVEITNVIEIPAAPGIMLSQASDEFKKLFFKENTIILSKGQGNFEGLYQLEIPDVEIYYLLKAKCPLMEKIFNVRMNDLIFKKKSNGF
ncbi:MAG: DUF89 domain-containing protein [Promethearchaeota archaeon]